MKKIYFCLAFVFIAITVSPAAQAHVLKFDNGIGAVLHMDPQDDPVAGELTRFYFEFSDKTGTFDAQTCDCSVEVSRNNVTLEKLAVRTDSREALAAQFTFPLRGAYQITVSGSPKNSGAFPSFTLSYVVRVNKGAGIGQTNLDYRQRTVYISAIGVVGLLLFLLLRAIVIYNITYHARNRSPESRNVHRRKSR